MRTFHLAGGCFWCLDAVYRVLDGVHDVVSGYTGGHVENPSYELICTGSTGHAEAVAVTFDPDVIPADVILDVFFTLHDPRQLNRQGNDVGTQYRSAVFCQNNAQRDAVKKMIAKLNAANVFNAPIVTQINGAETFYPAEDYHQYYFSNNPNQPYCLAVAAPKAAKILAKYAALIK